CSYTGRRSERRRSPDGSGVNREVHAPFCERPEVKLLRPTHPRLAPEPLIAAAAEATRFDVKPLTDPRLVEGLAALTSSLHEEASLSTFGRLAARSDLKRMLSTLLILADAEREDPAILTRPLAPPIFITGLPRSGTTFLHGLLAEDPANRAPRIWEAIYPYRCNSDSSLVSRPGSGACIRLRPTRRRNASNSRATCSAARASTTYIAPRPIAPGSTRLAMTRATGSIRGFSVISRARARRRDAGS